MKINLEINIGIPWGEFFFFTPSANMIFRQMGKINKTTEYTESIVKDSARRICLTLSTCVKYGKHLLQRLIEHLHKNSTLSSSRVYSSRFRSLTILKACTTKSLKSCKKTSEKYVECVNKIFFIFCSI